MNPNFPAKSGPFSPIDMDQIPEAPQRGSHHRRAHADTLFRLPDDLLFDVDLSALNLPTATTAGFDAPMAVDSYRSDESTSENKSVNRPPPPPCHLRGLSVDADFFDGLSFGATAFDSSPVPAGGGKRMGLHRRNNSMDGSASPSFEGDSLMDRAVKKAMAPETMIWRLGESP